MTESGRAEDLPHEGAGICMPHFAEHDRPEAKKQKRLAETMSFVYNHYNVLNFRRK